MFEYAATELASDDPHAAIALLALIEAGADYRLTARMAIRYGYEFDFDYPFVAGPQSHTDEIVAEGRRLMDLL
jgi:hypothetical protein